MDTVNKITTDNIPMIDELVYYLKKLSLSTVLKDQDEADKFESTVSIRESDKYIACIENRATFDSFIYNADDLAKASIPDSMIDDCVKDKNKIPENRKSVLLNNKINYYLNNYEELNDYYRALNGLPPLEDYSVYLLDDDVPDSIKKDIDISIPLHKMTDSQLELLYEYNVMDKVIEFYPDKKYLHHLGFRKISIYDARTASPFALLYTTSEAPKEVLNRYREKIEQNRAYTLKTIYAQAYKFGSDYYDNFIQIFIIIQTMMDILAEVPDMIIKREIFDIKTIELIFKCNDVEFFPEIPFKYQLAMVRNINRLIKYKSTTKNIVDICSLFGFDNIQVFKYYLLKDRKVDKYGNYIFNYTEKKDPKTGKTEKVLEDYNNFDLKFIKVPIEGICDDYIHDKTKQIDYYSITEGDAYWNGDLPHELVKKTIIDKEFNYLQSKYMSVDTIYSLTELSFQLIYFYNMLFDNVLVEEKLRMYVHCISNSATFKFVDVICYLYALMYQYNGVSDDLMNTPTKIMYIKGFNFDVDMMDLSNYIHEKGFTMKELGADNFQIPESSVMSYKQLMKIFTDNKKVYDHIIKQLYTADNKRIYDVYKKLYDSLMLNELTMDFFKKSNGAIATSYTDFLHDRDLILYDSLMKIKAINNKEIRNSKISEQINSIVYSLEDYVDTEHFKFLFSYLPSVSAEAIKKYIFKVINFFKSYKIDILGINTIYKFDDKLDNKIKMIDEVLFKYIFTREDTIEALSKLFNTIHLTKDEKITMIDKLYTDITYWSSVLLDHDLNIRECIHPLVKTTKSDLSEIIDKTDYIISKLEKYDLMEYYDFINTKSNLNKEEKIQLLDSIFLDITTWIESYLKEDKYELYADTVSKINTQYNDKYHIIDILKIKEK